MASITPSFELAPVAVADQTASNANGKATGLQGLIASVDPGRAGFRVTAADGPSWQVTSSGSTVYQGISGPSQLAAGMAVDMDVATQENGSLMATRIAVYDTDTDNLSVSTGPLLNTNQIGSGGPLLFAFGVEAQGHLQQYGGPFGYDNAVFQTSGQLTNMQSLPFPVSFSKSAMVAGQRVAITFHVPNVTEPNTGTPATTMTLLPQTINGTVSAVSSSGGFETYTVTLAAYDLFPALATQPGQVSVLKSPGSVVVYVDSNTQLLNTVPLSVGSILRFHGLVFNDNGTLRMDCAQVNDGVAE